uniref:Glucose dehydrogenase [FAD, quinone]-like isoform X1 n=2 Tax=Hirondellea gigas TaxID=1518452 RepID=A0A6A7G445_9CRUS
MLIFDSILGVVSDNALQALRLLLLQLFSRNLPYNFDSELVTLPVYDFVVVGAGAAGSVVAARLSELSSVRVLLLERGGSATPESAVPAFFGLLGQSLEHERLKTLPAPGLQDGYKDNANGYVQGRVMGGSTSMNAMIYTRGAPQDFDAWAQMGNPGWDYQSVLPYFKKNEGFRGVKTPVSERYHGRSGQLTVEEKHYNTNLAGRVIEAGRELGYNISDSSSSDQVGISPLCYTTRDGFRASASEAFLRPVVNRNNLHIRNRALVLKILFDNQKRAAGVQYRYRGRVYTVRVRKEVIVSAGAFNTPKLLMLSGVGPAKHLKELKIPVVAGVEGVGRNLQEHIGVSFLSFAVKKGTAFSFGQDPLEMIKQYARNRRGPLTTSFPIEISAYLSLVDSDPKWADVLYYFGSFSPAMPVVGSLAFSTIKEEYFKALFSPLEGEPETIAVGVNVARPKSKGWIRLRSSNPDDAPIINVNLFSHPYDLEVFVKGVQFIFRFMETDTMKHKSGVKYKSEAIPGCRHMEHLSDDYWRCFGRSLATHLLHPCGTCKMAPVSDPLAVLDNRLRVRSVKGVRVIDASIMPQIVTGNTMVTTYMIGEKGADLVKEDWGYLTRTTRNYI